MNSVTACRTQPACTGMAEDAAGRSGDSQAAGSIPHGTTGATASPSSAAPSPPTSDEDRAAAHRFRAVVDNVAEGIVVADATGRITYANRKMFDILGWAPEDLLGRNVAILVNSREAGQHHGYMTRYRESRAPRVIGIGRETIARHRDGRPVPIHLSLSDVEMDGGQHFVAVIRDNTALHAAAARIERLAYVDELTGLPNHGRLREMLAAHLGRPGATATLLRLRMEGLDKIVAATGRQTGQEAVCAVAGRITPLLPGDALLARSGEEGFDILLTDPVAQSQAEALASRIGEAMEGMALAPGGTPLPALAIGLARAPEDGPSAEALLEAATVALLEARPQTPRGASGQVRRFVAPMRAATRHRFALFQDLHRMLDAGPEAGLFVEIQPRYTAAAKALTGGEALMRWRRADGRLVPPGEFIPVAEETGMIRGLTDRLLERVVPLLPMLPPGQRIGINLPPICLANGHFAARLEERLAHSRSSGDRLVIEVTEGALAGEPAPLERNLMALRRIGCRIAIDDFGTGYSSLSRLRDLPIDELKIDRSFVQAAATGPRGADFLQAIAAMGLALGLHLVAEGVETEAELAMVRQVGCHEVQGWLWGRAMPVERFLALPTA
ncbi:putative bifunctional diguanylate cyclase/phosphodiesterase [Roseomonas gilardii]|uniref:putative bifunctional diguanylate cyclase/phosphodiesterase n=1 Tax=Roseomonas gilardii TaxID=257708 RepID=UPI0004873E78|nr:GGDEF domain-containing phosphodiesterase [Roseomonas gilardii]SUE63371.1 Cyclic di-GMP phosphodiesterase Gmr [Roseomonas gilardii subsp. rosea]